MPTRRMLARRLMLVALAVGSFAQAPTVLASCAAPEPPLARMIEIYEIVIVGTVAEVANSGRWATVQVDEVWKGGEYVSAASRTAGPIVEVRGGPEPGTWSSADRTFSPGRYLFTLGFDGSTLVDGACSGTIGWNEGLGGLRPAGAIVRTTPPDSPGGGIDVSWVAVFVGPALGVTLVALLVVGGSWYLSRRAE